MRATLLVALVAALLSAGGTAAANVIAPHHVFPSTPDVATRYGSVAFRIKVPRAPSTRAVSSVRGVRPRYISVSTKSFTVLTDGSNPVVANVNPASGYAYVHLHASVGTHVFTVTAYDRLGGQGSILSTGATAPTYVAPTGNTYIYLTLDGVVARVILALGQHNATIGSPAIINLDVVALDADGNTILANTTLAQPFTLTSSDPANGKLSQTIVSKTINEVPQYFSRVYISYTGANDSQIVFSATGGGITSVIPAVLVPLAPPPAGAQLLVTGGDDPNTALSLARGNQLLATFGHYPQSSLDYDAAAVDATAERIYVTDYSGNTPLVDVFTTQGAYALVDAFDPIISILNLTIDSVAGELFATTFNSSDIPIFSTASGHALLGTIHSAVTGGTLTADPIAHRLYVGGGNGLQVFSTVAPYALLATIPTGSYVSLALDPGAGRLYALGYFSSNVESIEVYATSNLSPVGAIAPVPPNENQIAVDPLGQRLYLLTPNAGGPSYDSSVVEYGLTTGYPLLRTLPVTAFASNIVVAPYAP